MRKNGRSKINYTNFKTHYITNYCNQLLNMRYKTHKRVGI